MKAFKRDLKIFGGMPAQLDLRIQILGRLLIGGGLRILLRAGGRWWHLAISIDASFCAIGAAPPVRQASLRLSIFERPPEPALSAFPLPPAHRRATRPPP